MWHCPLVKVMQESPPQNSSPTPDWACECKASGRLGRLHQSVPSASSKSTDKTAPSLLFPPATIVAEIDRVKFDFNSQLTTFYFEVIIWT